MPTFRPGATVLDAIGSTPLIEVDGIWVKLEYLNPSGSINARMARYIIERAESEGLLHPGDTIANGFVPDIYRRYSSLVDRVIAVHSDEAITEMRRLAREHGLLVGPSSGANLVAARRLLDEVPGVSTVVTICCDEGEKYLSEYFTPTPLSAAPRSLRRRPRRPTSVTRRRCCSEVDDVGVRPPPAPGCGDGELLCDRAAEADVEHAGRRPSHRGQSATLSVLPRPSPRFRPTVWR